MSPYTDCHLCLPSGTQHRWLYMSKTVRTRQAPKGCGQAVATAGCGMVWCGTRPVFPKNAEHCAPWKRHSLATCRKSQICPLGCQSYTQVLEWHPNGLWWGGPTNYSPSRKPQHALPWSILHLCRTQETGQQPQTGGFLGKDLLVCTDFSCQDIFWHFCLWQWLQYYLKIHFIPLLITLGKLKVSI